MCKVSIFLWVIGHAVIESEDPKAVQVIVIAIGYLPEVYDETPLLKTLQTWARDIEKSSWN